MGLYAAIVVLLHIPYVQQFAGKEVSTALARKLGTEVEIGRIDLGLFNRVVIDDVLIYDKAHKKMLRAARLSAKIDFLPLTRGQISISSAQIFGLNAALYKPSANDPLNIQFMIDSLASKDPNEPHTPLDLHIQSLVIRNGAVSYDRWDKPIHHDRLDPNHLHVSKLSSHLILYRLTDDSLSMRMKRLEMREASGLNVQQLSFFFRAGNHGARIEDLSLRLPESHLSIPVLSASFIKKNDKIDFHGMSYEGKIDSSILTPSDFAFLETELGRHHTPLTLSTHFHGTTTGITIPILTLDAGDGSIRISANGSIHGWDSTPQWNASIKELLVTHEGMRLIADGIGKRNTHATELTARLGSLRFHGRGGGRGKAVAAKGTIATDAGTAIFDAQTDGKRLGAHLETAGLDLGRLIANKQFGTLACNLSVSGSIPSNSSVPLLECLDMKAKGNVRAFAFNDYVYHNIALDGALRNGLFNGSASINDKNGKLDIDGSLLFRQHALAAKISASAERLNLKAMKITDKLGNKVLSMDANANLAGTSLSTLAGTGRIDHFLLTDGTKSYHMNSFSMNTGRHAGKQFMDVDCDLANLHIEGTYDFSTLAQEMRNIVARRLPALDNGAKGFSSRNRYTIYGTLHPSAWPKDFFNIPLTIEAPVQIEGTVNSGAGSADISILMPRFAYAGNELTNGALQLSTSGDTLLTTLNISKSREEGKPITANLSAKAANNKLLTTLLWNTNNKQGMRGTLNAETQFFADRSFDTHISPSSDLWVGDTLWNVKASNIKVKGKELTINNFEVSHNRQHLIVNGHTTNHPEDSLLVDMQDIDLAYIMNLVNFHSVDFTGSVSGKASVKKLMTNITANGRLTVDNFRFNDGRMGTLYANVGYTKEQGRINIDAVADDGPGHSLDIKGYISPKENYINLPMYAHGTNLEFLKSFCGAVMDNINCYGNGWCRIFGPLSAVNLDGKMTADGTMRIRQLNTTYELRHDTITFLPDHMVFHNDTVYDRNGNMGIVNGSLDHHNLHGLTYNLQVDARSLLSLDLKEFADNSFYGTVYATGICNINGKSGETNISVDATPNRGSFLVYDVAGQGSPSESAFIRWNDLTPKTTSDTTALQETDEEPDIPSDLHMNFIINTTPDFTLRLLMDKASGDEITLNGNGTINADYFNKGTFQMFGNYKVDYGTYSITIQNIIKRLFTFQPGSISFGGNPFEAALNLKAQYTVNAVSLADLKIGRSFTQNNVRVNCIMNILGTPLKPAVTFDLDLPSLSADVQQMVRSVINSEDDLNQQVLYLLAIGRFFNPGRNNADEEKTQSRTSLAMQSILSGTLSQQLSNMLSTVVHNNKWNIGANISTGDEGWSNAEYEGLLSGRMLNDRLIFNGQFGYRDNVETNNSSFIGDFDLRYLLKPNGNLAIRVYNQTNDRYFVRNTLTTQGIGLTIKKDFSGIPDLLGKKKKKKF